MGSGSRRRFIAGRRLAVGLAGAVTLSIAVLVSAMDDASGLGAPGAWPWLLTGLQVLALWSAGRRLWWGWLLGGMVQIPWIAYASMTGQIGFIPGCAISASVQIFAFLRNPEANGERTEIRGSLQEVML
jgi:hypothetical protein